MKLASLPQGRDGRLIVVSDDLAWYADADHIVPTLQALLDDWDRLAPAIEALAVELAHEAIPRKRFHEREAAAPLPRTFQWVAGGAYGHHNSTPLLAWRGGDDLRGARDPIELTDASWDADFAAGLCVVTGDVPRGVSAQAALGSVRLIGLSNEVCLHGSTLAEQPGGLGLLHSRPATGFSPVFVTPDALGPAWRDGRVHLPLHVDVNGAPFGRVAAGEDCSFGFGELIVHLARTRRIRTGTMVGSGTVSNRSPDGAPGQSLTDGGRGFACLAEQRGVEQLASGEPRTPYLRVGDVVRIEVRDARGRSVFGAIEQEVVAA